MIVYIIKNKITHKVYVGQTRQKKYNKRWWFHKWHLGKQTHDNVHLQNAWNKYGRDNFEWIIIDSTKTAEELNEAEREYIKLFRQLEMCYNITDGGQYDSWTAERRAMLSESLKQLGDKLYAKDFPGVISPTGEVFKTIRNLSAFCRLHNLRRNRMREMLNGKLKQHRGWIRLNQIWKSSPHPNPIWLKSEDVIKRRSNTLKGFKQSKAHIEKHRESMVKKGIWKKNY